MSATENNEQPDAGMMLKLIHSIRVRTGRTSRNWLTGAGRLGMKIAGVHATEEHKPRQEKKKAESENESRKMSMHNSPPPQCALAVQSYIDIARQHTMGWREQRAWSRKHVHKGLVFSRCRKKSRENKKPLPKTRRRDKSFSIYPSSPSVPIRPLPKT